MKIFEKTNLQPKLYLRYVDDIFAVFDCNDFLHVFFNYINNVQPNLQFTLEKATTTLSFLDVELNTEILLIRGCTVHLHILMFY